MMWTDLLSEVEHLSQVLLFGCLMFGNQAVARWAQDRRARREAERIRLTLRIGAAALRRLYKDNLRLIAEGNRRLVSGRNQIGLMRIQLGRLAALQNEAEIEIVLAANFAAEAAETALAMAGQMAGSVFTLREGEAESGAVQLRLQEACAALEAAETMLMPAASGVGLLPAHQPPELVPSPP